MSADVHTAPASHQQGRSRSSTPALPDDFPTLARCLARAFERDPVLRWLFPDANVRRRRAEPFYVAVLQQFTDIGVISTVADRAGVAIWQPPDPSRLSIRAELRHTLRMVRLLRGRTLRARYLLKELERAHHRGPHWYLAILGTEPESRGLGVASTLLAPILHRCDRDGTPAFLESSNEANLPFYRRHGFEVVTTIRIEEGPTLWPMLREPQRST